MERVNHEFLNVCVHVNIEQQTVQRVIP